MSEPINLKFENFSIQSYSHRYSVHFVSLLSRVVEQMRGAVAHQVLVIDQQVEALYQRPLADLLKSLPVLRLPATEEEKTLAGMEKVLTFLQEQNSTKKTHLVCVGGGIIQDICTLASHLYYRGISWTFIPTTLLAMGDSCIGAKASINLGSYKNQIGAFHAPEKVLICPEFLNTLSAEELRSGYGEILKLYLIGQSPLGNDRENFLQLLEQIEEKGFLSDRTLEHLYHGLQIKKGFIETDEFDRGIRNVLNYGHTFGHALESLTHFEVQHGTAIGIGMDIENWIAYRMGICDRKDYELMHEGLKAYFSVPIQTPLRPEQFFDKIKRDKKVVDGSIRMALAKKVGQVDIASVAIDHSLLQILEEYFKTQSIILVRGN